VAIKKYGSYWKSKSTAEAQQNHKQAGVMNPIIRQGTEKNNGLA
jgi:hypothetical protein